MIDQEDNQKTIKQAKQFKISLQISKETLKIILQSHLLQNHSLEAQINSLSKLQKLSQYFETYEEISSHLKQGNYQVDLQNHIFYLTYTTNLKKGRKISLATFQLTTIFIKDTNYQLTQLIERCQQENLHLGQCQLKMMIKKLAQIIYDQKKSQQKNQFNKQSGLIPKQQLQKVYQVIEKNQLQLNLKIQACKKQLQKRFEQTKSINWKDFHLNDQKVLRIEKSYKQVKADVQRLQGKYNNLNLKMQQDLDTLIKKVSMLTLKVQQICDPFKATWNFIKNFEEVKNNQLKQQEQSQKIEKILEINNLKQINKEKASAYLLKWIDLQCKYINHVTLVQNTISTDSKQARIFGIVPITQAYSYKIKIINIGKHIGIGIIDSSYRNKPTQMYQNDTSSNTIILWSSGSYNDGFVSSKRNNGFKQGEIVTVSINLQKGKIQWKVGSEVKLTDYRTKLRQKQINWVPYIRLSRKCSIALQF